MMEPTTLGVGVAALLTLGVATWLSLPRPPRLDGERWFKTWLITLLRGETERDGGSAEDWAAAVVTWVPWHPAGRLPERKILQPEDPPAAPALDGELELQRALADLSDPAARWERLYDLDPEALALRLEDPSGLGEDYDPARWLGADVTWDALAEGAGRPDLLERATDATWVVVGERLDPKLPNLEGALANEMGPRCHRYDPELDVPDPPQRAALEKDLLTRCDPPEAQRALHLLATLGQLAPEHSDHLVLVAVGGGIVPVMEALRTSPVLRDQVDAVLAIGAPIQGLDDVEGPLSWEARTDWLQAHFRHEVLDLEAAHRTPYLSLQWLDRQAEVPGAAGVPLARARFPEPPTQGVRREALEIVDLGVLPARSDLPVRLVALALWGTVTAWIHARR